MSAYTARRWQGVRRRRPSEMGEDPDDGGEYDRGVSTGELPDEGGYTMEKMMLEMNHLSNIPFGYPFFAWMLNKIASTVMVTTQVTPKVVSLNPPPDSIEVSRLDLLEEGKQNIRNEWRRLSACAIVAWLEESSVVCAVPAVMPTITIHSLSLAAPTRLHTSSNIPACCLSTDLHMLFSSAAIEELLQLLHILLRQLSNSGMTHFE